MKRSQVGTILDMSTMVQLEDGDGKIEWEGPLGEFLDENDDISTEVVEGLSRTGSVAFGGGSAPISIVSLKREKIRTAGRESMNVNPVEPTVRGFLTILTANLTQYDMRVSAGEAKRGSINYYRLGHLLGAAQKIEDSMSSKLDSSGRENIEALKSAIKNGFDPEFPPAKKTIKSIDAYLTTGKVPKYPVTAQAKRKNPEDLIEVEIKMDPTGALTIRPTDAEIRRRIEEHLAMFGERGSEVFLEDWRADEWIENNLDKDEARNVHGRGMLKLIDPYEFGMMRGYDLSEFDYTRDSNPSRVAPTRASNPVELARRLSQGRSR